MNYEVVEAIEAAGSLSMMWRKDITNFYEKMKEQFSEKMDEDDLLKKFNIYGSYGPPYLKEKRSF